MPDEAYYQLRELLRRLKGVELGTRAEYLANPNVPTMHPSDIPVPADDPTLINQFYGTINRMGVPYEQKRPYRPDPPLAEFAAMMGAALRDQAMRQQKGVIT